jgi:hypothetical protein
VMLLAGAFLMKHIGRVIVPPEKSESRFFDHI